MWTTKRGLLVLSPQLTTWTGKKSRSFARKSTDFSVTGKIPWQANRFSGSEEISCILWNTKVHHGFMLFLPRTHQLFITVLTKTSHLFKSWPDESSTRPPNRFSMHFISSSHPCLGIPGGLFSPYLPTTKRTHPLLSPTCDMPSQSHVSWYYHQDINLEWSRDNEARHCTISSSLHLPRPSLVKILPQHPILRHPQPSFFHHCESVSH